jgi:hypothetical protein
MAFLVPMLCFGQQKRRESLFVSSRFQAAVVVRKHPTGADLVVITILKPSYSHQLLEQQIEALGKELKSAPRGVSLADVAVDRDSSMLKASFAVDGLIERATGTLHVQPIARALALATHQDSLEALLVQFEGETPTSNTLKESFPPELGCRGAEVEGKFTDPSYGVEYRVKFLTHDAQLISIPDSPADRVPAAPSGTGPQKRMDWGLFPLILVAACAMGALVYSLLLRGFDRGRTGDRHKVKV